MTFWQSCIRFPKAFFLLVLTAVCVLSSSLSAQTFRGGINGDVTDATGATVSGATVTLTNEATKSTYTSVTSSAGSFLFNDLPLGAYQLTVTDSGFSTVKVDKIPVSAGVIYTLPSIKLSAAATQTVEVQASDITLDTTTVTQNIVLESQAVADMPLNGRDFTQMIQLTPGFAGYTGGGYGSLNGTRANQMNWQIDGVDNNDLWHNVPAVNQGGVSGIAGIVLPIDAVEQFSAQTQSGPEGGRNPGGTINLTLKSGTNHLHGSAYYFNRNELFGAKSPFSDTKQKVRNYNWGFSVGAPILKDKLFGFLTFEKQRFVIGESGSATEPSIGWQNQAKAILAAKNIPVNTTMQKVLNTLWAGGNLSADTVGNVNNFHSNVPEFGYSYNGLGKVDYHITDKDSLSAHWFVGQGNQVAPVGSQIYDYFEVAPIHVQNVAVVYNRMLSPSISNQLLVGVNYFNQVFNDANTNFNVQSLGFMTGAPFGNAPNITITGFDPVGMTPPEGRNDITGHLTDQLSWVKGKHQIRLGGEFRQAQLDEFYKRHSVGSFTFDGTRVGGSGLAGALADFLAGYTSAATIAIGDPERQVFVNTWELNAGDSWQLTRKLSFNYGVRYDYVGPLHNGNKDLSVFRPEMTSINGIAFQGNQIGSLYQQYYKNFSPRLGITYGLDDKTVIRAGYGFYFDTPNLNPFLDNRPGNQAPNGVEGNPAGPNPVYTISAAGKAIPSDPTVQPGKTTIVGGQAIFPSAISYPCSSSNPCGVFSVDRNFRTPYNQNYSLNIEHTIGANVIAQLGYVGSEGRRLLSLLDLNQLNVTAGASSLPYASSYPQYGNINQIESIGTSNYNSLQAQLRVMHWHGLMTQAAYTWSHNLDQVTAYRGSLPQDNFNFKGDYGNSDFDTRNTFTALMSYEVPGAAWGPKELTHGWQLNSLLSFHGGQPFTVHASGDISGTNEGNDRAVQIGNPLAGYQGQKPGASWLNPAAFTDPAAGHFGTTRRNGYYGPGYSDVDFSVFKNTKVKELMTIQFRAEMFNLFNRINYAPPSSTVGGSFSLYDTIGDYNGAPGIGAGEPFNTQFGLKILF